MASSSSCSSSAMSDTLSLHLSGAGMTGVSKIGARNRVWNAATAESVSGIAVAAPGNSAKSSACMVCLCIVCLCPTGQTWRYDRYQCKHNKRTSEGSQNIVATPTNWLNHQVPHCYRGIGAFVHLCICAFVHLCFCAFVHLCFCVNAKSWGKSICADNWSWVQGCGVVVWCGVVWCGKYTVGYCIYLSLVLLAFFLVLQYHNPAYIHPSIHPSLRLCIVHWRFSFFSLVPKY